MARAVADAVIAAMVESDVAEVQRLERESFTDPWSAEAFVSTLRSEVSFGAVARSREGGLLGYVIAWFAAGEGEIANLAVSPAQRGQGIGGRLLDVALEEARGRRTAVVYLEVRGSNASALALYLARGFSQVGRRRAYYRKPVEDAIVLRLDLVRAGDTEAD